MAIPSPTEWLPRALELVPWQWASLPGWNAYATAVAAGLQIVEDEAQSILAQTLDNANGVSLDQWGDGAVVRRDGMPDSDYRVLIRSKGYALTSGGSEPEVLLWASKVWGADDVIDVVRYSGLLSVRLIVVDVQRSPGWYREVRRQADLVKPAGVRLDIEWHLPGGVAFTYDDGPGFDVGRLAGVF